MPVSFPIWRRTGKQHTKLRRPKGMAWRWGPCIPPLFYVNLNANTCIALNSKQCTCVAFNLNASFELDVSSIRYLESISNGRLSQKYLLWPQSKWWRWYRRQIENQAFELAERKSLDYNFPGAEYFIHWTSQQASRLS